MKKWKWLSIISLFWWLVVFTIIGCVADPEPDSKEMRTLITHRGTNLIPMNAKFISVTTATKIYDSGYPAIYVVYEYKGECFMQYDGSRQAALTITVCPVRDTPAEGTDQ